ncbi:MAG: penicillin-binding protein 2 [Candidatus Wolfebacteria bacterium]|nr:penicillin-binding protein 2 [Candidatus Wolfebacteria bacterium]
MNLRTGFITFLFCVAFLVIIANLYSIQFIKGSIFSAQNQKQNTLASGLDPIRGNIYILDKNKTQIPIALNKEYSLIFAVPKKIGAEFENYAAQLSTVLGLDKNDLEKKFKKPNDLYELLIQKADQNQVSGVSSLNLKGVYLKKQFLRYYPFDNFASHVVGFVSPANDNDKNKDTLTEVGRYGIEAGFNAVLAGKETKEGDDLVLTIDRSIQAQAEEILSRLVTEKQATGGTIIVQDPYSGRILAMANLPNFDPNNYSKSEIKNFLNPAVAAVYEPGSVFKVITMAIGIDSGKITPDTKYTDTGSVTLNGRTITNWDNKAHGTQTMTYVIEHSLNTGAVFAEKQIGHGLFFDYLKKFGLNDATGIKLPSEVNGSLRSLVKGKDINFATASYGQGVSVTPINLISAISIIANGGNLMKPLILDNEKQEVVRRVISEDTAKKVTDMMVSAVEKNFFAAIRNYSVAGKTGTAFIPDFNKGGYTEDVINSYVGFAPAYNPKFVILIKLDKPAGAPLSGQTVVPAFKELAQFILNYYNVPPDKQ